MSKLRQFKRLIVGADLQLAHRLSEPERSLPESLDFTPHGYDRGMNPPGYEETDGGPGNAPSVTSTLR